MEEGVAKSESVEIGQGVSESKSGKSCKRGVERRMGSTIVWKN